MVPAARSPPAPRAPSRRRRRRYVRLFLWLGSSLHLRVPAAGLGSITPLRLHGDAGAAQAAFFPLTGKLSNSATSQISDYSVTFKFKLAAKSMLIAPLKARLLALARRVGIIPLIAALLSSQGS